MSFVVERSVVIATTRATVWSFFSQPARFAEWWGPGSVIEDRPGGAMLIRYPNGETASGQVVEVVAPERIVFTYGYQAAGKSIAPGASRVEVTLAEHPGGTLVTLRHEVGSAAIRDEHVAGWRFQLSLFAVVAARVQHAELAARLDGWFAAWAEPDADARTQALAALCSPDVIMRDDFAALSGVAELSAHITAVHRHMPGHALERDGAPRHCQGTALVAWLSRGPDGVVRARGDNVVDLAPDGRIARVVGLWRA